MANEIAVRWHDTGATLYAQVLNATGQVYNGSTFETPADANWNNYDIALTEAGTTRIYRGTFPAVAAGVYSLLIYLQAGASPAVADTLIGLGDMEWSGTAAVVAAAAQEIADTVLSRGVSNVEATADAHSLTAIILAALESSISGVTWTIKRTDGTTPFTTKTVTVDAAANPITAVT